jgi:hypothetical protein
MTKRDLILLTIAPVILVVISMNLLWLSGQLHLGAERRLADYAALQRATALSQVNGAPQASVRSAQTLSSLTVAGSESDAATVSLSVSLAALLLCVALFQIVTVVRLLPKQRLLTTAARPDSATSVAPEMKLSAHRSVQHLERVGGS